MNRSNTPKEILGGQDGKARCQCGKPRYPRYKLCPKCYYERKEGSDSSQPQSTREHQPASQQLTPDRLKNLSTAEVLQMRSPMRMSLPDRHERIQFLEKQHGKTFRGKEIRYMKNSQLYAISQQAGYRRR
jgi:hypothetical protein